MKAPWSKGNDGNLNFHSNGKSVFEQRLSDPAFMEYRRQWRDNPRDCIVAPFPLHLDIETTNACNLRCPHCAATGNGWGAPGKGFMQMALFRKILEEATREGVKCLKFSLRGEPLIHPQIIEMIQETARAGIPDFYFNTNGMLLSPEIASALIDAGLPRISISVDGWDRQSFNAFRLGAEYEVVCANIASLMNLRRQRNSVFPQVRVQAVMLPEFKPHWPEYHDHWSGIVDEVGYLDAREEGPEFDHRGIITSFKCPFLWQRMVVLWDGTVLPCLAHGVANVTPLTLGNAGEETIKTLWTSHLSSQLRKLHCDGLSHRHPSCDECSFRALEAKKLV